MLYRRAPLHKGLFYITQYRHAFGGGYAPPCKGPYEKPPQCESCCATPREVARRPYTTRASPVQGEVARRRRVGGVGKASLFIQKRKSPKAFSQYTYYNHVWCFILVFLLLPSALSYLPLFLWGKGEVQWAS